MKITIASLVPLFVCRYLYALAEEDSSDAVASAFPAEESLDEAAAASKDCLNVEVNFAFGGAQTGSTNRALECLGGLIADCDLLASYQEDLDEAGLILPGLTQQFDFAMESLTDVEPDKDLFLLYAAGNDYFGPYPTWDPAVDPPAYGDEIPADFPPEFVPFTAWWSVTNLANALETIYTDLGAGIVVMGNWLHPCGNTLACGRLQPPEFQMAVTLYAGVWVDQFDAGIQKVVSDFNANHTDAIVIFVDVLSKINELFESGDYITNTSCQEAGNGTYGGPDELGNYACTGYALVDDTHPTTAIWSEIVDDAVVPAIEAALPESRLDEIRRVISFGDSYSDFGSFIDTLERTDADWAVSERGPPTNIRSAINGATWVELLESALDVDYPSVAYIQESGRDPITECV